MKILFGVFSWGLGHATRSSPFIEGLLKKGHEVHILSTGRALKFLKERFKGRCKYFDVPSINAPYTKSGFFVFNTFYNMPKMYSQLNKARKLSREIIRKGRYDKVISDMRLDVYDQEDNSYLFGHQLKLDYFPLINTLAEIWLASSINKRKYDFILDFESHEVAGWLSERSIVLPKSKIKYIGLSSHIKKKGLKKDIDYFISISGPEPQRSVLEEKILAQIHLLKGKIVIAGGNPDLKFVENKKGVIFYSFLNSKQQEEMMNRAKFVIARSGYTTMMEFAELGIKNALLIPTPGQTEQEGLAQDYEKRKIFHYVNQDKLNLKEDVKKCRNYGGFKVPWKTEQSVKNFLNLVFE